MSNLTFRLLIIGSCALLTVGACQDDVHHMTDVELPAPRVDTVTVIERTPAPPPDTVIIQLPPDTVTIVIDTRIEDGVWCKFGDDLHRAARYPWEGETVLWTCEVPEG